MRLTPTCNGSTSKAIAWLVALALASALAGAARAEQPALEVIPLAHRPAAELLPLLQPFVAEDGVIKAAGDRLIVRTTPANVAELRKLAAELDRPLRQLLIEVKQLSGDSAWDGGAEVGNGAKLWRTDERDDADRLQRVQVMEGAQAFIDVGRQIPIQDFVVEKDRAGTRIEQDTRYVGATTGFYAIAHVSGDTATLDINPYQTTAQGPDTPPAFNLQSLHTTVRGKLGVWIELGASTSDVEENHNGITYSTSQRGERDRRILLRVTVVR